MKTFYKLLANSLVVNITNTFVWIALIYWAYLSTRSVLATSIISGVYLVLVVFSGFWFGSIVDHHRKKTAMIISSVSTLVMFVVGLALYELAPAQSFETIRGGFFWIMVLVLLLAAIAGNIRNIAMPTLVTLLVPEGMRARANGMVGMIFGASFAVSNVAAGVGLGFLGMRWVLILGVIFTLLALIHLLFIRIDEPTESMHPAGEGKPKKIDIKGTISVVRSIPGLFPLIFFTTFNNFLGGVFMSLMDAYGLSLVSVEVWGTLWGVLSLGFILGGFIISKKGVGKNPVRTIFTVNMILWTVCIFMAVQPSIVLLASSMLVYLSIAPFVEASEQTVIQRVVPAERQGRVFGFAQSVEQAASPITAFLIGPLAQFFFIPFMTTGKGVDLIGSWYGVGEGRGIGLVFTFAGFIGLIVTMFARSSKSAKVLAERYSAE